MKRRKKKTLNYFFPSRRRCFILHFCCLISEAGQVRPAIQPLPGGLHMDPNASIDERDGFRNGVEKVKSVSDKHIDLLRPSARYYATSKGALLHRRCAELLMVGQVTDATDGEKGKYTLVRDPEDFQGIYDKPLPCFGCGMGWFSLFSFGICVPVDVVLWHISLLWKLLPEGSKGAGGPCRCCNWGNAVFCRAAGHNSLLFSVLDLAIHFQVSSYGFIHFKTEQISVARNCMRNVDKMFRRKSTKNVDTRLFLHSWRLPSRLH
ncbi:hypothetical protein NC653_039432 [Populus alba x Populus x berolinensis]|uniref:Uncharacterized protein n=1 Tax=Populus alba x Populus x berolinensis TaxID=444605 RepID=A0AAD6LB64_9ROSI|nr:hypothetical protein NC653_039432 [Populus alba x Populus x berolinensis]